MSQLVRIKSVEEYHDLSNFVFEELKAKMKVAYQPVGIIWKVLQKEESGKVVSYTCLIWMVQLILE